MGRLLKLFVGPKSPKAGPTFPIEDAELPIAETKSSPSKLKTPAPIINRIRYRIKKAKTCITTGFSTTELLCLKGMIALGCNDLLNSSNPFLIKIKCLKTLTPP